LAGGICSGPVSNLILTFSTGSLFFITITRKRAGSPGLYNQSEWSGETITFTALSTGWANETAQESRRIRDKAVINLFFDMIKEILCFDNQENNKLLVNVKS
jgi:hypothetical protein